MPLIWVDYYLDLFLDLFLLLQERPNKFMVKKFFIFTGIFLGLLLLWMLWNIMQFSSRQIDFSIAEEIIIEDIEAVKHLSNAITYKTISPQDSTSIDSLTFLSFNNFLRETYPLTFATLEEEIFSNYTILLKWNGENRSSLNTPYLASV